MKRMTMRREDEGRRKRKMTHRCGRERESINECESVWEFGRGRLRTGCAMTYRLSRWSKQA